MMDANQHVLTGQFTKRLEELDLVEISHKYQGGTEPNTFIEGSKPIDGVWALCDLEIGGFKMLPFSKSVGDHRTMIFDVSTHSLTGKFEYRVARSASRCLNTKTSSLSKYNTILEEQMTIHKMDERLDTVIEEITKDCPMPEQSAKMESLRK